MTELSPYVICSYLFVSGANFMRKLR